MTLHNKAFKGYEEIYLPIQNRNQDAAYQKMYGLMQQVINVRREATR